MGEDKSSRMLSFFLEFWVFSLSFENFSWVLGKILSFFQKNLKILTNHGKFYHFFLFLKIFVNKNGVKSATPLKILSFDEKVSWNLVFFLSFANGRESPPKGWVFFLSFLLEFCPWVLVFSAGGVKKKPDLAATWEFKIHFKIRWHWNMGNSYDT